MKIRICLGIALVVVIFFAGCKTKELQLEPLSYDRQLLPGQDALRKITDPLMIPDFTLACLDLENLQTAVDNSLNYLGKPSSQGYYPINGITHAQAVQSLEEFGELLDLGLSGSQLNSAIRDRFDVYMSVGCDDMGTVLFTGYYTPIFDGSEQQSERFKYPLYSQPENLVKASDGKILGRTDASGNLSPYPPRAVIENSGMLEGSEIIWLADPFEAYITHVQGSAKIRLPDGKVVGIGYAANNGREYISIARELVKEGKILASQMSLSAMIDYFKSHIDHVAGYTSRNPRYVFFKREEGQPRGSINEPVTPMRTIATDKSIFPRAALTFVSTVLPRQFGGAITQQVYSGFTLDQDTGGAIRAPGRCDFYMGIGDEAGKLAGQTYQEGKLYYLFLKFPISPPLSNP